MGGELYFQAVKPISWCCGSIYSIYMSLGPNRSSRWLKLSSCSIHSGCLPFPLRVDPRLHARRGWHRHQIKQPPSCELKLGSKMMRAASTPLWRRYFQRTSKIRSSQRPQKSDFGFDDYARHSQCWHHSFVLARRCSLHCCRDSS